LFELIKAQSGLESDIEKTTRQIKDIQEFLENLKGRGKVSASDAVHAGVKIAIRDQVNDIHATQHSVTFAMDESGVIKAGKYEAPDESLKGELEGYASPGAGSGAESSGGYSRKAPEFGDTADGISKRARSISSDVENKKEKSGGLLGMFKKGKKEPEEKKDTMDVIKLIDKKNTDVQKK
jgi:hypothetical protein